MNGLRFHDFVAIDKRDECTLEPQYGFIAHVILSTGINLQRMLKSVGSTLWFTI